MGLYFSWGCDRNSLANVNFGSSNCPFSIAKAQFFSERSQFIFRITHLLFVLCIRVSPTWRSSWWRFTPTTTTRLHCRILYINANTTDNETSFVMLLFHILKLRSPDNSQSKIQIQIKYMDIRGHIIRSVDSQYNNAAGNLKTNDSNPTLNFVPWTWHSVTPSFRLGNALIGVYGRDYFGPVLQIATP